MGAGREVAFPSYRGFETDTFIRFGILTSERNVVSLLGNVNAATAARPDQLLIGTAQYQYQTALAGGTTQIFRMMGPLLELMAEAARHEEDDYGRTIHAANYAAINTTLAEIAVLMFATNGSDIGSNPNVHRRNVLAPTAPLRLKTHDEETADLAPFRSCNSFLMKSPCRV